MTPYHDLTIIYSNISANPTPTLGGSEEASSSSGSNADGTAGGSKKSVGPTPPLREEIDITPVSNESSKSTDSIPLWKKRHHHGGLLPGEELDFDPLNVESIKDENSPELSGGSNPDMNKSRIEDSDELNFAEVESPENAESNGNVFSDESPVLGGPGAGGESKEDDDL